MELGPENTQNPFDRYCDLLVERAHLYDALQSGRIVESSVIGIYNEELAGVNSEIDTVMGTDGFVDAVVNGGIAAEQALGQLNDPVILRRRSAEALEEARQPILLRLEAAASFLYDYAAMNPNILRIIDAARTAGLTLVRRAVMMPDPDDFEQAARDRSVALPPPAAEAEPQPHVAESPLDNYLTLRDAGLLAGIISRFSEVLVENSITPPDASILEGLFTQLPEQESSLVLQEMVDERVVALDRIIRNLATAEGLDEAVKQAAADDPRRRLIGYLSSTITDVEKLLFFQDLVRAERQLTIVLSSPSRSGPMVDMVDSSVVVQGTDTTQPSARPSPKAMPKQRTVPAPPLAGEKNAAAEGDTQEPVLLIADIDHLITRLSESDKVLARVCLARLTEVCATAMEQRFVVDGTEAYPASYLGEMFSFSTMISAIKQARDDRILGNRLSSPRDVTVDEAALAILYSSPAVKGFVARNKKLVVQIMNAVRGV